MVRCVRPGAIGSGARCHQARAARPTLVLGGAAATMTGRLLDDVLPARDDARAGRPNGVLVVGASVITLAATARYWPALGPLPLAVPVIVAGVAHRLASRRRAAGAHDLRR